MVVLNAVLELWDLPAGRQRERTKPELSRAGLGRKSPLSLPESRRSPGGEKVRAVGPCGPPTPPLPSASGFAQALRSTELTVNVVTSGNSQRGRGKGLEEGARTPGPQFPSCQHPPVSCVALSYLLVKRGDALSLGCARKQPNGEMNELVTPCRSSSQCPCLYHRGSWYPNSPPCFRDRVFLCIDLDIFSSPRPHTGNAGLRLSTRASVLYKPTEAALMDKATFSLPLQKNSHLQGLGQSAV